MKISPNGISECNSWEEAIAVINNLKLPPLSIKGYYNADKQDETLSLDLDHIWDTKKVKRLVTDQLLQVVGLANHFIIEH